MMDKELSNPDTARFNLHQKQRPSPLVKAVAIGGLLLLSSYTYLNFPCGHHHHRHHDAKTSPYGRFPHPEDPFLLLPCTNATILPPLEDASPLKTWSDLFDPNPDHWIWGNKSDHTSLTAKHDLYAGRGIYMCGYLDVPLDHTNTSDPRITRLAITKLQVGGLELEAGHCESSFGRVKNTSRTIVVEPGGPGGSGTSYVFRAAEAITERLSEGTYDVLGWDPRGVNASLPAISCFPYNADRDQWSLFTKKYRAVSASPMAQLEVADVMNDAIFKACKELYDDIPRFVSTAFVARDMEEIRKALGEEELTGYLVSYGPGIGQTYANMFPDSVGRMILDGTEYVKDHRELGGFGWTALDNVTDAWHDGFLGECINAGPDHCALAKPVHHDQKPSLRSLGKRMEALISSLTQRPMAAYIDFSGPSLVTYSVLMDAIYGSLYNAQSWPATAQMLFDLEAGNTTLAAQFLETHFWEYDPTSPPSSRRKPSSDELEFLVICADAYDAPLPPDGLVWWESLWANMTRDSWIAGDSRFGSVFPCRHFTKYWPEPAEVYRGNLSNSLKNPVLLIAETYDPATPLRNGRRLAQEMGRDNARLVAHHGYGHSSRDKSACTDEIAKSFIMKGELPDALETDCYADEKPYLYVVKDSGVNEDRDPLQDWREHLEVLEVLRPRLQ